jgi:hypothetical protein
MAKSSEFAAVGRDYNIIRRRGNADHIISDETKNAGKTAIAAATREGPSRYRTCPRQQKWRRRAISCRAKLFPVRLITAGPAVSPIEKSEQICLNLGAMSLLPRRRASNFSPISAVTPDVRSRMHND